MRRMGTLALLLLAAACTETTITGPGTTGQQRFVASMSFCEWVINLPAGMSLDAGHYDLTTETGSERDVPLSAAQLAAIRQGEPVRFWAETRARFTIDLRLRLRGDTTYLGTYPTLVCERSH